MNLTHMPSLMRLDQGVYSALGYNGRGVAMATVMGRELASLVNNFEGKTALPLESPTPIPFHTFRQVGVTYRLTIGAALDRLDHALHSSKSGG
jgi:glycine/D-amino acid oxidase-like deaminating enzyme